MNFKESLIDESLYQKDFMEHNDEQKITDSQINFNNQHLIALLDDFFNNLNQNEFDKFAESIKALIKFMNSSNPIIVKELIEYSKLTENNIVDTTINLLIIPPRTEQKGLYYYLLLSLFSIKSTEITEYVISNSEYIQFFDTTLFQYDEVELIVQLFGLISLIADHLTTLHFQFSKLFPSFSIEKINSLFQLYQHHRNISRILIKMVSKLCINLGYGIFHFKLAGLLIDHYQLYYEPNFLFDVLIQYMKKYPKMALDLISGKDFLTGSESRLSVFDLFCPDLFKNKKNAHFYNYCYYALKFLLVCVKKLNGDVIEEIFKSLPVGDVCDLIFDNNASQEICALALKILIADYQSVQIDNEDGFVRPNVNQEEISSQPANQSIFFGPPSQSFLDAPPENQSFSDGQENQPFFDAPPENQSFLAGPPNQSFFDAPPENQSFLAGPPNKSFFDVPENQPFFDAPPENQSFLDGPPNQSFFNGPENQPFFDAPPENQSFLDGPPNQSFFDAPPENQSFLAGPPNKSFFDVQENQHSFDEMHENQSSLSQQENQSIFNRHPNQSFFDAPPENQSIFVGPPNQSFSDGPENQPFFDAPPENQPFFVAPHVVRPHQKPDKTYILNIFYDHVERSNKICQMFQYGNFKLKFNLLSMVKITVKELLHTGSPFHSKSSDNDVALLFLDPNLIQVIVDMLFSGNPKLSALVIEFLDVLIMKAIELHLDTLIELISEASVVESLNEFVFENQDPGSDVVKTAKYILSVIQRKPE